MRGKGKSVVACRATLILIAAFVSMRFNFAKITPGIHETFKVNEKTNNFLLNLLVCFENEAI